MKILFHHRIASRDGQSVHLDELTEALRRQGHEVVLVGPPAFSKASFGSNAGIVDAIKRMLPGAVYELLELAYNAKAYSRLTAALREHRPDVVYERFSLFLLAGIWARRRFQVPLLLEVNGPLCEERQKNDGLVLHRLGRWAQRWIWNGADICLPVTDVLAGYLRRYDVPEERIAVIMNGINRQRFDQAPKTDDAKAALGLDGRLLLGFTGFIREWHKLDRVIDFVAEHYREFNLHLLLVGDGPVREDLIRHAVAKGIADRMTITGVVGRDDVAAHVAAFDIALQPGITEYASPLKLFEYMYLGRAVAAPDMANLREVLTHEENGLLFDPADATSLNAALLRLCRDPSLRARIGRAARATIDQRNLTWDGNAARVVALAEAALHQMGRQAVTTTR